MTGRLRRKSADTVALQWSGDDVTTTRCGSIFPFDNAQKQRDRIAEFLNGSYLGNGAALPDLSSFHAVLKSARLL